MALKTSKKVEDAANAIAKAIRKAKSGNDCDVAVREAKQAFSLTDEEAEEADDLARQWLEDEQYDRQTFGEREELDSLDSNGPWGAP